MEEFVDLDIEEFQRRANDRLLGLIERHRAVIEADLGHPFEIVAVSGRIELHRGALPVFVASTTAAGRLLLTDVSGRFGGRL
ncbi:MAG: hypothetical protein ACKV2O_15855 [Acidimicrobiales bacterium]